MFLLSVLTQFARALQVQLMLQLNLEDQLGPIHANAFSFENSYFLMGCLLSSALKRPKTPVKTEPFKKGFKRKRIVLKTLRL